MLKSFKTIHCKLQFAENTPEDVLKALQREKKKFQTKRLGQN